MKLSKVNGNLLGPYFNGTWILADAEKKGLLRPMTRQQLDILATAVQAGIEAGRHFAAQLHVEKVVRTKSSPADLVTEYDTACETMIRSRIHSRFPDHAILGEETTDPGSAASIEAAEQVAMVDHLWIVDPIDGTTNFVHQLPLSVVSIGYAEKGQVVAGVIFDPYRDEVFFGGLELGACTADSRSAEAWASEPTESLPGLKLVASPARALRGAVVATGFPTRAGTPFDAMQGALVISRKVKSVRAFGAAALHMAYVAAGRLDGFWEYDLNAWDLAAGACLVRTAGGTVKGLDGSAYSLLTRDVVACGQAEFAQLLTAELQELMPKTGDQDE